MSVCDRRRLMMPMMRRHKGIRFFKRAGRQSQQLAIPSVDAVDPVLRIVLPCPRASNPSSSLAVRVPAPQGEQEGASASNREV